MSDGNGEAARLAARRQAFVAAAQDLTFQAACQRYAHSGGTSAAILSAAVAAFERGQIAVAAEQDEFGPAAPVRETPSREPIIAQAPEPVTASPITTVDVPAGARLLTYLGLTWRAARPWEGPLANLDEERSNLISVRQMHALLLGLTDALDGEVRVADYQIPPINRAWLAGFDYATAQRQLPVLSWFSWLGLSVPDPGSSVSQVVNVDIRHPDFAYDTYAISERQMRALLGLAGAYPEARRKPTDFIMGLAAATAAADAKHPTTAAAFCAAARDPDFLQALAAHKQGDATPDEILACAIGVFDQALLAEVQPRGADLSRDP